MGVHILSTGSSVPNFSVENQQFEDMIETSDHWISTRTGIKKRHLAPSSTSLTKLAAEAANKALYAANLKPTEISLIILATSTPDDLFGSASQLQAEIGATTPVAFDITAACSGFIVALVTAAQFIQLVYDNILVVGADTCLDGLIGQIELPVFYLVMVLEQLVLGQSLKNSILGFKLCTDGQLNSHLQLMNKPVNNQKFGGTEIPHGNYNSITMNGKEVYKFAVFQVPTVIRQCLNNLNISIDEVDWFILHQANTRIIEAIASRLSVPFSKMITNLEHYGNTSAASIPLALDEAIQSNKIQPGQIIVLSGFGAGLTWGAIVLKW
uniref:Beta-ketoacyl-[acyl-carrier-protein] synthase III n=1 Tax=Pyropia yezoensis TaxID=2788 RepID=FABH_PYRYE|nr:3-oxoacyl-acyl-carrier-protein synthase 3 [Neopyropia yezoensis]Q1XDU1.1 RecName: Full=Beta-ketoacyl-[acyl-carrier-protein] synthase III; Short=Beta-ketoacyl-ACP synthase III; Short=KAS III; AltName: Full=3-oxoacyl-[acyl-carrier-protein] synthase 3; AltName: Full=3-oxoacyl-[acyl-carrier-protein] synthase III [Neopyropia yezoensis]BAE92320.1 beta-ketoacyl-acyl carrier protein synthase III [Neopyropia yezoensis]